MSDFWSFLGISCLIILATGLIVFHIVYTKEEENKIVISSICIDGYLHYIKVDTPRYKSYAICPAFENTPDGIRIKTCGE